MGQDQSTQDEILHSTDENINQERIRSGVVRGQNCDIAFQQSLPVSEQVFSQPLAPTEIVWVSGGGSDASVWRRFQTPFFDAHGFSNITFDNRGIGKSLCYTPSDTWTIEDMAQDTVDVITTLCHPPVILIGTSLGAAIVQQVLLANHKLVSQAFLLGSGAFSTGWGRFYQEAEIEYRENHRELEGDMAIAHYAAMLYPAAALGDRKLWPFLKSLLREWIDSGDSETTVIPQWRVSLEFDQREQFHKLVVDNTDFKTSVHVLSFEQDVEAPPQDGQELASLIPNATFNIIQGAGHCSWYGHLHETINTRILDLVLHSSPPPHPRKEIQSFTTLLIAMIACEGIHEDKQKMFQACQKEVKRLLQDSRAVFIYWNGTLWIRGVERKVSYPNLTQDSTWFLERVQEDILREIRHSYTNSNIAWALLVGAHVQRPKTSSSMQSSFDLNTGYCHFPTQRLLASLKTISLLLIDGCCGNQIDMEGFDIPYIVCALDGVGYVGLVGKDFWSVFPNPYAIAASAETSKKRRARWRVITSVFEEEARRTRQ